MQSLQVELDSRSYPVFVGGDVLRQAGQLLTKQGFRSAPVIVSNSTVLRFHGRALLGPIENAFGTPPIIRVGDGERFKNHSTLLKIYDGLFRARADRRSWILSFGGGVAGDVAGFAAATFMRGIPYVNVPTTLLAQVDSAIGGKVGINVDHGKNLIGAFHQPSAVLSDTGILNTLPRRELAAGLYEAIKCGAIRSEPLIAYIEKHLSEALECRPRTLEHIVLESSRIKADVVSHDEKEEGLRMVLNYGHTVGHALEAATEYRRFKHGEAVAWGMIAAVGFGRKMGLLRAEEAVRLARLIRKVAPLPSLRGIALRDLWAALNRDKKFRAGSILMILLPQLGTTTIHSNINPVRLKEFLVEFLSNGGNPSL